MATNQQSPRAAARAFQIAVLCNISTTQIIRRTNIRIEKVEKATASDWNSFQPVATYVA